MCVSFSFDEQKLPSKFKKFYAEFESLMVSDSSFPIPFAIHVNPISHELEFSWQKFYLSLYDFKKFMIPFSAAKTSMPD